MSGVEVEQIDRESAADEAAYGHGTFRFCDLVRAGEYDDHHTVQAFARHRLLCAKSADVMRLAMLDEICAHLGAAVMQIISTDDQIIAGHVRTAHDLAKLLRKANK